MLYSILFWLLSAQTVVKPCPCRHYGVPHVKIHKIDSKKLPQCVTESSGLLIINDTMLTINDSGGLPFLYRTTTAGSLIDSVLVPDAKNSDWEALTYDRQSGVIYIGDFGNNNNNRTDLCVYKYQTGAKTQKLLFTYTNQHEFPPNKRENWLFDCEAMVTLNSSIFLFSKHKCSNQEMIYQMSVDSLSQKLYPLFRFKIRERITGATMLSNDLIACLSYGKILIYKMIFADRRLIDLQLVKCKRIPFARQSEGITYDSVSKLLYVSNEQRDLYVFKLCFED